MPRRLPTLIGSPAAPGVDGGPAPEPTATVPPLLPVLRSARGAAAVVALLYWLGAEAAWGVFGADAGLAFFPPAGITLAALALSPRRRWPALLATIAAVELVVDLRHSQAVGVAAGYTLANVVEPLVGASLLRELARRQGGAVAALGDRAGMGRFLVAAMGAGPIAAALVGASVKAVESPATQWLANAAQWWAGDALGVLIFGAPILVAAHVDLRRALTPFWEAALLAAGATAASVLVFMVWEIPLVYLMLPLILWAAFRFGAPGVSILGLIMATIADVATARGVGPFAAMEHTTPQVQLGLAKLFLLATVLTGWFFAIEVGARLGAVADRQREREARLFAERGNLLGRLKDGLNAAADLRGVLRAAEEHLRGQLGVDALVVVQPDPADAPLRALWAPATPPELRQRSESPEGAEALLALAAAGRTEPAWAEAATGAVAALGPEAAAALPLEVGPRRLGVLLALWSAPQRLSDWERTYLHDAAEAIAQALERARLLEAERAGSARLQALQAVTARLAGADTVAEINAAVVTHVMAALDARGGGLGLLAPGGDRWSGVAGVGYDAPVLDAWAALALGGGSPSADALRSRQPVFVDSPDELARRYPAVAPLAPPAGDRAWASLPLMIGGRVAGVLFFGFKRTRRFTPEDKAFLAAVADQCAQALERAQLRESEHAAVVELQRSLLTQSLQASDEVSLAARYRPASSPLKVGGDWYDALRGPDGTVTLIVGDVTGGGLHAALTMSRLRSAARALAARLSPAELLTELDRYTEADPDAWCTTVLCARVGDHELRYAAAGHPPALLRRGQGVELLNGGRSAPLGVARSPRPEASAPFEPGDLLLLYTDGLIERRGEVLDVGIVRLADALRAAELTRPDWCDALIDCCLAGAGQADDLAVLAAQRRAPTDR
ncbi:MAG: SpoIIE family protein phosphatase [Acidimicrobiales bacterium]